VAARNLFLLSNGIAFINSPYHYVVHVTMRRSKSHWAIDLAGMQFGCGEVLMLVGDYVSARVAEIKTDDKFPLPFKGPIKMESFGSPLSLPKSEVADHLIVKTEKWLKENDLGNTNQIQQESPKLFYTKMAQLDEVLKTEAARVIDKMRAKGRYRCYLYTFDLPAMDHYLGIPMCTTTQRGVSFLKKIWLSDEEWVDRHKKGPLTPYTLREVWKTKLRYAGNPPAELIYAPAHIGDYDTGWFEPVNKVRFNQAWLEKLYDEWAASIRRNGTSEWLKEYYPNLEWDKPSLEEQQKDNSWTEDDSWMLDDD
jgi:hypothetical protein